jgi:PAS domain S-box-containing protein
LERLALAYLRTTAQGKLALVSPGFEKLSGRSSEELLGRAITSVLRFDTTDQSLVERMWRDKGNLVELPCSLPTPEGLIRRISLRVVSIPEGGLDAVAQDVTFWEEERSRLREEARRCRTVSELTSDCAYALRVLPGGIVEHDWTLGSMIDISGYTLQEIRDRGGWGCLLLPSDEPLRKTQFTELLHGRPCTIEYRIQTKNGSIRRIRDVARPVLRTSEGVVTRIEGVLQDVTEGRELERELAESRDRYRALFESANAAIFIADAESGIIIDVNGDAERLMGRSRAELVGMHQSNLHPPDELENYLEMFRHHVQADRVTSVAAKVVRSDGVRVPVAIYGSQSVVGGRKCQIGVFHDLTEQKRAEAALRAQDALRQAIIDHAAEGIIVCHRRQDTQTVEFSIWNDRMAEMTGYDLEEINQLGWFEAMWPDTLQQEHARQQFARVHEGEVLRGDLREVVCKNGHRRLLSFSTSLLEGTEGARAVLALVSDMTDRERMLEQLRQSEKMEAIGQLAGGIAHDFNNQLAGILGLADLLARDLSGEEPIRFEEATRKKSATRARQILEICLRARDVTQQLLAFARRGRYQTAPVDVNEVVHQIVSLLTHSIDKRIELRVEPSQKPAVVLADTSQLQSALLNIALNARDAMPTGGQLSFSVSLTGPAPDSPEDGFVQVAVSDTGTGMSEATRSRVFEPFFTTKPQGKGTGMGLAAVYGTVKSHGGLIDVESALGTGTTFRLLFPRHKNATPPIKIRGTRDSLPSRRARILLVDDEQVVRETLAEVLRELGHEVTSCVDGQEALDRFLVEWRHIDLVVLDMVMPRRGGHDVFRRMLEVNPNVRVLLISGHSVELEAREVLALGAAGFLQKPFSIDSLAKVVDQVLAPRVTPDRPPLR